MAAAYATVAEYEAWANEAAPTNAVWLLDRATEIVDSVVTASFAVDSDTELPSDVDVAATLRDATCAQVRMWVEVGVENDVDGLAGTDVSVGGLQTKRAPVHSPQMLRILREMRLA